MPTHLTFGGLANSVKLRDPRFPGQRASESGGIQTLKKFSGLPQFSDSTLTLGGKNCKTFSFSILAG